MGEPPNAAIVARQRDTKSAETFTPESDLLHETSNSAQMQVFLISMQILVVEVKKTLNKY